MDLILGYEQDTAPIIIDQPEDNLAVKYINSTLTETIKAVKWSKQVIMVSHNATIPMMADAQTIVVCENDGNKITIRSASLESEVFGKKYWTILLIRLMVVGHQLKKESRSIILKNTINMKLKFNKTEDGDIAF